MKRRAEVDPDLHTIRSAGQCLDGHQRQNLEAARFNIYAAFEAGDALSARRWARAARASLLAGTGELYLADVRALGLSALDVIERAIEEAP